MPDSSVTRSANARLYALRRRGVLAVESAAVPSAEELRMQNNCCQCAGAAGERTLAVGLRKNLFRLKV